MLPPLTAPATALASRSASYGNLSTITLNTGWSNNNSTSNLTGYTTPLISSGPSFGAQLNNSIGETHSELSSPVSPTYLEKRYSKLVMTAIHKLTPDATTHSNHEQPLSSSSSVVSTTSLAQDISLLEQHRPKEDRVVLPPVRDILRDFIDNND